MPVDLLSWDRQICLDRLWCFLVAVVKKICPVNSTLIPASNRRFNDISVKIRTKCVQYSMHFLLNHPELRSDITETLKFRQHDSDEAVR